MMTARKAANAELVKTLISDAFWRASTFPRHFTETFTMDFPSAPPGMPAHFSTWESERCFTWLNRTVRSWYVTLDALYTTPDENVFWAECHCHGDVLWADHSGHFASKVFYRIHMKDGKVDYLKAWADTLAFYRAAGIPFNTIVKHYEDPAVTEFLANTPRRFQKKSPEDPDAFDHSDDAKQQRLHFNLEQNRCGIHRELYRENETFHPDYKRGAWFIPDEQPWANVPDEVLSLHRSTDFEVAIPPEVRPRIFAWVKASSPWMYRDTRGINYPTDDPNVFFAEMYSSGPARWIGNPGEQGHYHQEYLMFMLFDDDGRELIRDEILCPLNKFNSANLSIPSFPYYY